MTRRGRSPWPHSPARVPGAEFAVVPGAAHGIFSDRPEEALGILRPWLREHDPA